MDPVDEPELGSAADGEVRNSEPAADPALPERIRELVQGEPFAVLCTQGDGQPYGSVIAFAINDDLNRAAFCTARATRKYRLLTDCRRVALVVDDRSKYGDETRRVSAITATGSVTEIPPGPRRDQWRQRLVARHPYLKEFISAPSCALFQIDIVRYLHVARFQEVSQWVPPTRR